MNTVFIVIMVVLAIWVLIMTYWNLYLYPKLKGWIGELVVRSKLSRLSKDDYKVYNDIYLMNEKGQTSQIDHLVVSRFGIFVIETKNYRGWIFGNDYDPMWTLTHYKAKTKFPSPVRQNFSHVKAIEFCLQRDDIKIIPIVCFTESATIKTDFKSNIVITSSELRKTIKYYQEEVMTLATTDEVRWKLQESFVPKTRKMKRQHVRAIKRNLN